MCGVLVSALSASAVQVIFADSLTTLWAKSRTTPDILEEDLRLAALIYACTLSSLFSSRNHFLELNSLLSYTLATLNSLSLVLVF